MDLESTAKKRKQSLEEAGREIRRELFEKEMQSRNACKIALAHHENDNAETFCGICAADADCMDWAGSVRSTVFISVRFSE